MECRAPVATACRLFLALIMLGAACFDTANAAELKWRSGRTAMSGASRPAQPEVDKKAFRARSPVRRVDTAVQQTALFDDQGPQLSNSGRADDRAQWRSVVVDAETTVDAPEITRSAQLPATGAATDPLDGSAPAETGAPTDVNSQLEEDLRMPFGTQTEPLPATEPTGRDEAGTEPESDTLQQPADGRTTTPDESATQRAPGEFRPNVTPPAGATTPPRRDNAPAVSAAKIEEERRKSETACADSMAKLRSKTIDTVDLSIAVVGTPGEDYPFECTLNDSEWHGGRCWPQTTFMWKAAALCHKPLYFEDAQLERYGHSFAPCCQPLISGAHFFCTLPVMPYCMGVEPPLECIYALGHYRPGSCAPYMIEPVPLSYRGALFQAGAVVGAAAALP